ncbi:MAG: SpoIIIAC/SpoIIIAD family protein [Christensenellales bacterium]
MELIKVILLGLIVSILAVFLKQVKGEYALICVIVGSIIILSYIFNSLINVLAFFENVINKTGVNNELFLVMLKIIGIGYLVEFSANVCRDSGNNSIADKVVLAGKIMLFVTSMPIISSLFNMVLEMVQ